MWTLVRSASLTDFLAVAAEVGLDGREPPRVFRRLQPLRGWSHEEVTEVLT